MTIATSEKLPLSWVNIFYMAPIHAIACLAFFPSNFSWGAVGVAFVLYCLTEWGITVGFHRLAAHKSFEANKYVEYFFIFLGTLACQGGPLDWIGLHRIHHKHSDTLADPHNSKKGFLWSHWSWMMHKCPAQDDIPRYIKDLEGDRFYQFCQNFFIPIQVVLGLALFFWGGSSYVIWAIFFRLVVVFHCTWLVNSATHFFGYKSHESQDGSLNCWWVALLTFGEGWHNNHHAFQYSARHGLKWWEIDITWMIIKTLSVFGLVTNIKLPKYKESEA